MEWNFYQRLTAHLDIDRSSFDCGDENINQYIKEDAVFCENADFARTFLMVNKEVGLIGFYTLSSSVIPSKELPDEYTEGIPKFPIPCILIGQFAISKTLHGQKLSYYLLADTYKNIIHYYKQDLVGFWGIRVDTQTEEAKSFWTKQGFISFKKRPTSLFIPIKTLLDSI